MKNFLKGLKAMKQSFKDGMKTAQNGTSFKSGLTKSVAKQVQNQNKD